MMEKIIKTIKNTIWLDDALDIKLGSKLKDDLGLDSLDMVEITMRLEEEYEIGIPDEMVSRWDDILDIVNTVKILTHPSFF